MPKRRPFRFGGAKAEWPPFWHGFRLPNFVVMDADYIDRDCFDYDYPVVVPARTFLSQLL